jgi:hypothetical protein
VLPELRKRFNAQWRPERYAEFVQRVDSVAGTHVDFRCSETPVFFPKLLLDKMARYGRDLYDQLAQNEEYRSASECTIPARFRVPNEAEHSLFVQADFGLVREADGTLEPKLVEIQGFPSLYAFQPVLAEVYRCVYGLDPNLQTFLGDLDEGGYKNLLQRAIVGGHAPENVVLLEIDPYEQKTVADFLLTRKLLGIKIASVTDIKKSGRKLYFEGIEVKRVYNRAIVDELVRKKVQLDFDFTDDLDVEWAGHPNWFFRLSKFSLPWFKHVCVPETRFLSEVKTLPDDLHDWVLKPLYSFAGMGVKISPLRDEILAVPESERPNFILQRKLNFVPVIETPSGMTKVETRIMYIWDGELKPVTTIIRTGRGKMMGVDFNKDLDWVGASAGFYPPE